MLLLARAHARLAAERRRDELLIARAAQATKQGFDKVLGEMNRALKRPLDAD